MGNRTPDLVIANDALYQLSYSPDPFADRANRGAYPPGGFAHRSREVKYLPSPPPAGTQSRE